MTGWGGLSSARRKACCSEQTTPLPAAVKMEGNNPILSSAATEMSDLIEDALKREREKNRKLKAKLSNANRKLKKKGEIDENAEEADDTEDPGDPNSGWLKPGELAIVLDHMENNLHKLVGNGKSAQYKKRP